VKSANEDSITCTRFKEQIRAYIDNELSDPVRKVFLAHAVICAVCRNDLECMEAVRRKLSGLAPVTCSPEFNFELRSRIRYEKSRMRNPLHRLRLYVQDNIRLFLTLPALAVVLIVAVTMNLGDRAPVDVSADGMPSIDMTEGVELISGVEDNADEIVYVYYVLESVQPSDKEPIQLSLGF